MVSSVRVCDCVGFTTDTTGITLTDGIIPSMIDDSELNWATQLYTATTNQDNWNIELKFPNSFMLRQVDLYLFFCPSQMIPNQGVLSIKVYQDVLFPHGFKGSLFGTITLNGERQSCADLTQISIPTNTSSVLSQYLIEFSMENILGGIYMGELNFLDTATTVTSSKIEFINNINFEFRESSLILIVLKLFQRKV